jgi:hypothetical protein
MDEDAIFQQDNAPFNTFGHFMACFAERNIPLLNRPARSLKENLQGILADINNKNGRQYFTCTKLKIKILYTERPVLNAPSLSFPLFGRYLRCVTIFLPCFSWAALHRSSYTFFKVFAMIQSFSIRDIFLLLKTNITARPKLIITFFARETFFERASMCELEKKNNWEKSSYFLFHFI